MSGDYILFVVFAIMAIAFWNEKGSWLFAGYNMMSDKEKQKYHHKKLCRVMSCCMATVDILLIISHITGDKYENIFTILGIIVGIVTVILVNTICREK